MILQEKINQEKIWELKSSLLVKRIEIISDMMFFLRLENDAVWSVEGR